MKASISKLLSIAGLHNSKQKYMCAYYIQSNEVKFLHVVEMPTYKNNAYIAPFGIQDGLSFPSDAELDKELSIWLKSNRAERYEDRSAYDRMRDILNFDTTIFKTK